jgi:hypothetical protein
MSSARGFPGAALASLIVTASAFGACSGGNTTTYMYVTASPGGSPSSSPTSSSTATPTPPPPGTMSANPTSLSINGTGAGYAQSVYIQEAGYTGAFNENDTCTSIASVTPNTGAGPAATFTVTPSGAGTCAAKFADTNGRTISVAITVTTTGFTVQTR